MSKKSSKKPPAKKPTKAAGKKPASNGKADPRRQQSIAGTQKPSDSTLDEIAVPLMHMLDDRGTMDDKIAALREQLHNRMKAKKVKSYQVDDGPLSAQFKPTETERLSIRLTKTKDETPADTEAAA